jgi:diacylglycerol kinase family enzyme
VQQARAAVRHDRLGPSAPWWLTSAVLAAAGRRRGRRAAMRGLASVVAADALLRRFGAGAGTEGRPRRSGTALPRHPGAVSGPPSRQAAAAAAFVVGVGMTEPALGLPMTGLAVTLLRRRLSGGDAGEVLAGGALGGAVAMTGSRLIPSRTPSPLRTVRPRPETQPPRPDGAGVVILVNPRSGSGRGGRLGTAVRRELPAAEVGTLEPGADVPGEFRKAARRAEVLGVCGGDGTVGAAAQVAIEAGLPLLVLPGGTFNHFAADLGIDRMGDALAALRRGTAVRIDVGLAGERLFLNTSSLGSYPAFVAVRERWEGRVGKPAAAAIALWIAARQQRPLRLVVDGLEHDVAMMFIGNGRYQPQGFAPSWRPRLDDGRLDLRMVTVAGRAPLLRLALSILTGRLGRSRLYFEDDPVDVHITRPDGPGLLAGDGEIALGPAEIVYRKLPRALIVYQPSLVPSFVR